MQLALVVLKLCKESLLLQQLVVNVQSKDADPERFFTKLQQRMKRYFPNCTLLVKRHAISYSTWLMHAQTSTAYIRKPKLLEEPYMYI